MASADIKTFYFDDIIFTHIKKVDSQQKVSFKLTYEKENDISQTHSEKL